jgi:gamma-tubulin complex component 3
MLETTLVRDVLYACQGIDGKYVRWQAAACDGSGGYAPAPGITLPLAEEQLTLQLCELGWLFR